MIIDSNDVTAKIHPLTGVAIAMALDAAGRRDDCTMRPSVRAVSFFSYTPTGTAFISVDVWYAGGRAEGDGYAALYELRVDNGHQPELFSLAAD